MDKVGIISIGDELLFGEVSNTNASWLASKLSDSGLDVSEIITIADDIEVIAETVTRFINKFDYIIVTGGLGPTGDDITREGIAKGLGEELIYFPELAAEISKYFEKYNRKATDNNFSQAYLPAGAEPIINLEGTAPGFYVDGKGYQIFVLPGVPIEMKAMVNNFILEKIKANLPDQIVKFKTTLRIAGIGEATLEDSLKHIIDRPDGVSYRFLPQGGEIAIKIALDKDHDPSDLEKVVNEINAKLGEKIYGGEEDSLPGVVAELAKSKNISLAFAESCTGGLLAKRLTDLPGASAYLLGSAVTYSTESKISVLGIKRETLNNYGVVSREIAGEMAEKVRNIFEADVGIGVTGIAGPTGGSDDKPVGLIYFALSIEDKVYSRKFNFSGDRKMIRWFASQFILNNIRLKLMEV